jgi:hypothetical protein
MIWTLKELQTTVSCNQIKINGKWVSVRPINYTCRTFAEKVREAWAVYNGRAEAFIWPENQ